jgi:PEGA domain
MNMTFRMMPLHSLAIICCLLFSVPFYAKDKKDDKAAAMVLLWPDQNSPTLRLSFGKFQQLAAYNGQLSLESNVLIENMSGKRIPQASFTVYMTDKGGVRIGDGVLSVSDLDSGQAAKVAFQVMSVGIPASLKLVARNDSSGVPTSVKTMPLKVVSVPPGATLKVDGRDQGFTPATIRLTAGTHTLAFSKEGYASGSTPVEIKPDEAPGGSITFELGGLSRDNVELRDGKVLQGDVLSVSMTSVVVRVDGKDQTYDRNQVEKIILVERETVQQPATVQPAAPQPK